MTWAQFCQPLSLTPNREVGLLWNRWYMSHSSHAPYSPPGGQNSLQLPCYVGDPRFSFKDSLGNLWVQYSKWELTRVGGSAEAVCSVSSHTHIPTLKCHQTSDRNALAPLPKSSARCPGSGNHCFLHGRLPDWLPAGRAELDFLTSGLFSCMSILIFLFCIYYYFKCYSFFFFNFWQCHKAHKIS